MYHDLTMLSEQQHARQPNIVKSYIRKYRIVNHVVVLYTCAVSSLSSLRGISRNTNCRNYGHDTHK